MRIRIRTLRASAYGYLRPPLHPLAASPRSRLSSPSSTASPHAWAYCSGRCGSNLRIRVKNCRILLGPPRSSGLGGRRSSSRYLAMASPVLYCLGGSRIRASTADPGVVSSAVPSVPVESGTLHTATLPHFYRPRHAPAASEAASTMASDYSVLASPLPAWFLHQEGPRRPASSRTRRFYFTPGEFLFRSGQIF